jgi:hypothetical protein
LTRSEVKKQIARGWVNSLTVLAFLNVDLATLDQLVRRGKLASKTEQGSKLYRLDDVLSVAQVTVNDVLDKQWPVDRSKKPTRGQQVSVLKTQTERDRFTRRWFHLHKHVSQLIATPKANMRPGELKLVYQLLTLAYRVRTLHLVLTNKQLMDATGLDDEALPAARRGLEGRGLLEVDASGTPWAYRLLDPKTRRPFTDDLADDDNIVVIPEGSWADFS